MNYAVIAAGQGSRLQCVDTPPTPKPLLKLGGEPMIARLVSVIASADADRLSVITNPAFPETARLLRSLRHGFPIDVMEKSTGGSMESFSELATIMDHSEPFCLLTVDTVFRPEEFRSFIKAFEDDTDADGYMAVTTYLADEKPLFIAASTEGDITGFLDRPVPGVRYVSGGIYALRPSSLAILADCAAAGVSRMRDFQRALLAAGMRLKAWEFSKIIDVDRPQDVAEAEAFLSGS